MADVVASGVVRSVLDRLGVRIADEVVGQLSMGVGAELKKLEGTLCTIGDVLEDAEARQVQEKALGGWLRRLKDAAYDIDDLLDEDFAKNRKRTTPESSTNQVKGTVSSLLSLPKSVTKSVISQLKIVRKIREIRERLDELAAERSKFHLQERVLATCCCRQETNNNRARDDETSSFVVESEVYGRKEDKKKIVEFLVEEAGGDNLGVIAIVGMGGLGKTTLAQLVYNDRQISSHFQKKIWVCVSDDFDPKRLVGSMIEQITGNACDLTSMELMQSKLKQELDKKKRFLLVLDDVWNENNYEKWDRFRTLLTVGAAGSKVIVTTRSSRVASLMATVEPHFLNALSEDDCWLLFERRAFGLGACCEQSTNLVTLGKEIVKKCGGVPLAAKALGCLMRSKRRESEWSAIGDNDIWKSDENGILPALRLSYDHLPSHLKQCFAYCSVFPKDTTIKVEELIQLWIAEGFIRSPDKTVMLEDIGLQHIEELVSRSLFEKTECSSDYNTLTRIKIHDLVHDLAQSAAGEECSIIDEAGNRRGIYPITRYSSFIYKTMTLPSILEALDKAKKLRTCYFVKSNGDVLAEVEDSQKQKEEEKDMMLKILQTIFSSMKLLRALYLRNCAIVELPTSVSNLRHLRYLNLSNTCLETVPQSIGLVQSLQILNLKGCKHLKELPDSIGNLTNLLALNLKNCKSLASLPTSIGRLKSLQTLNLRFTKIETLPETWCCLSDLRSILLASCHCLKELPGNMKNMKNLTNLDVGDCSELTGMPEGIGQLSRLRRLPSFVPSEKLECGLRELNGLNLEGELLIRKLENVKSFQQATEANLIEKHGLESLELSWDLNTYKKQMEACARTDKEGKSRRDLIEALAQVEKVLEGLRPHGNLTTLYISGYQGKIFPKWLESSLPNLVELRIYSCIRCETFPDISQLRNLKYLTFRNLPAIKSLPPLGRLPSLKSLRLKSLHAIKSLGSEFCGTSNGAFPALETMQLECMPELEEWRGVSGRQSFPRLSELVLLECPKLRSLSSAFPSVELLFMNPDNELLLSSLRSGAFPNLKHVKLVNFDGTQSSLPQVIAERSTSLTWRSFTPWKNSNNDDSDFIKSIAELLP